MPRDFVKYGKAGAIATVTLNRPEKFNRDGVRGAGQRRSRVGDRK